ncbi:MAG: hypothetical protein NC111_04640 [Bacteroides sp.]|nr:hypothetical protein [Bacteroides sp.]MCM1413989.1 hypothetical protein [Bacteroides sp.]MCM1471794.1 hypothetical protein [Bacteroides sp.]
MKLTKIRAAIIVIFASIIFMSLSSFVRVSVDPKAYRRNNIIFGKALIDCFGQDTILKYLNQGMGFYTRAIIDTCGNIRTSKLSLRSGYNHRRELPNHMVEKFSNYCDTTKLSLTWIYDPLIYDVCLYTDSLEREIFKPKRSKSGCFLNWPTEYILNESTNKTPLEIIYSTVNTLNSFIDDKTRTAIKDTIDINLVTPENYNTANLIISMMYALGECHVSKMLDGNDFTIIFMLDSHGYVLDYESIYNASPIFDSGMKLELLKSLKQNKVKFLASEGSTVTVIFPGKNHILPECIFFEGYSHRSQREYLIYSAIIDLWNEGKRKN